MRRRPEVAEPPRDMAETADPYCRLVLPNSCQLAHAHAHAHTHTHTYTHTHTRAMPRKKHTCKGTSHLRPAFCCWQARLQLWHTHVPPPAHQPCKPHEAAWQEGGGRVGALHRLGRRVSGCGGSGGGRGGGQGGGTHAEGGHTTLQQRRVYRHLLHTRPCARACELRAFESSEREIKSLEQ